MSDCCSTKTCAPPSSAPATAGKAAIKLRIQGLCCAEEVASLKRELSPLFGGDERFSFDILTSTMTIRGLPDGITIERVTATVDKTGMKAFLASPESSGAAEGAPKPTHSAEPGITTGHLSAASAALTIAGMLAHGIISGNPLAALGVGSALSDAPLAAKALYALAIACGAWKVAPKALFAVRRLRPDMNLLMVVAMLGAMALGDWLEAATVATLFALSLTLESWSVGRARHAVASLMSLSPPTALLDDGGGVLKEVPAAQIAVGNHIVVKPGERIPLDGQVVKGSSSVDQAPITGESRLVPKQPGESVFAGTINGDGLLTVEVTKISSDTTLARIIAQVADSQARRAPSEQWVETFAKYYTPLVMAAAVATMCFAPLLLGAPWQPWIYRALVLLVIACPCALVISTPVSIVAALALAAKHGVLVKGGANIEIPARVRAIALDKTGTLTRGQLSVAEVVPIAEHTPAELLERAAALEQGNTHPVAAAILRHAEASKVKVSRVENYQNVPGKGATGIFNGRAYWIGSARYFEERGGASDEAKRELARLTDSGRTVVVIGNDAHVCGFITLADEIRAESRSVVESFRAAGVEAIVMLTGDNEGTAKAVASATDVDSYHAELLPLDKVREIERLVAKYQVVAMVGDGVNDAPGMARASLGIAMGAAGSDAAIETADIALMNDDLSKIPWLIGHSHRTLRVIRQNIGFSLAVKAVFVTLSFAGIASLWGAIAADMGTSLLVVFNGLRLLREGGSMKKLSWSKSALVLAIGVLSAQFSTALAAPADPVFKIGGKVTTYKELSDQNKAEFYDIDKKQYELLERQARQRYLEKFSADLAAKNGTTPDLAMKAYTEKAVKVSDAEVKETLAKFKDNPQLAKLTPAEAEKQIRAYLEDQQRRTVVDGLLAAAFKSGELAILFPKPEEPLYDVVVAKNDHVRYGPAPGDSKPLGCEGEKCPITVVEYSEFQCPFCQRVQPAIQSLLTAYKGKVRFVVRDFPLSFHDRARPAGVAAKCAGDQGKFWEMYTVLFDNQKDLSDEALGRYADKIAVDKPKWSACIKNPAPKEKEMDANIESGMKYGVSGTPAYFINGRRLSGAMPFEEFKRVIDEELAKKKS